MRSRLASQRGADTLELAGLLLVAALVITAIFAIGLPGKVSAQIQCTVTSALGGTTCQQGAPGGGPVAPWDSTNPVTRATWGGYVSLGDSYSAGEGLGGYQPGSHIHKSQCEAKVPFGPCIVHKNPKVIDGCDRSSSAYNGTVSGTYHFADGKGTYACSGATTSNIYDGSGDPHCNKAGISNSADYGEGCQVDHVNANTSLVTLTIGGNDAGFSSDISSCYEHDAKKWIGGGSGSCASEGPSIDSKISAMGPRLIADLQAIRKNGPHARIIVLTYPRPFPEPPTGNTGCVGPNLCLTPADQEFFNQEAAKLDSAICSDVQAAGVGGECVNAYNAFNGCEIGTQNSCVQSPSVSPGIGSNGRPTVNTNPGSYHPTARGQQILGDLINQQIQNPPSG